MIIIKSLNKHYGKQNSKYHALKNINLELPKTGFICILGQSGSGKTTLMNIIGSLDTYDSGNVTFRGKELKHFTEEEVANYRSKNVGFIFQDYNVIDKLTVEENVNLAINVQGKSSLDKVHDYLDIVELKGLEKRKINELSGGQKQRVAIARALIKEPDILLCDEATGNVDSNTSAIVANIIKKISKEKLVIFVTHDRDLALNYADRIINIKDGEITSDDDNTVNSNKFKMKFSKSFGSNVTEEEVYDAMVHAKNLNVALDISINPSSSAVSTEDMEVSNKLFNEETTKAKGAWKYFFSLAVDNIKQKKLRTFIVMLTFMLVLTITSVARSVSTYAPARDYAAIMNEYGSIAYGLELTENTGDYYGDNRFTSGKYVYDEAINAVGSENLLFTYDSSYRFEEVVDNSFSSGLITNAQMYVVMDDFDFNKYNFVGSGPTTANEIVVTSAIARFLFGEKADVNDYIGLTYEARGYISGGTPNILEITGVIQTDYTDTYVEGYLDGDSFSIEDYDAWMQQIDAHLAIFTNVDFFESEYYGRRNSSYTSYSYSTDLFNELGIYDYTNYFRKRSGVYETDHLIIGSDISSKDEVLITPDVFNFYCFGENTNNHLDMSEIESSISTNSEAGNCANELFGKTIHFELDDRFVNGDMSAYYNEDYLKKLGAYIDFDSIYPNGAKIVGISNGIGVSIMDWEGNPQPVVGYIVADEVIDDMYVDTIYNGVKTYYSPSSDDFEQVQELVDSDFSFISNNYMLFESVDSSASLINYILTPKVLIVMTIILALIPAIFMYLFINISIDLKKKEIGILKSIGSSNNQVMSIFLLQSFVISIITLIVTAIAAILVTNLISSIIFKEAIEYGAIGYIFTLGNFVYIAILTVLISFVSLIIPYIKFNRKPPINIVKDL